MHSSYCFYSCSYFSASRNVWDALNPQHPRYNITIPRIISEWHYLHRYCFISSPDLCQFWDIKEGARLPQSKFHQHHSQSITLLPNKPITTYTNLFKMQFTTVAVVLSTLLAGASATPTGTNPTTCPFGQYACSTTFNGIVRVSERTTHCYFHAY